MKLEVIESWNQKSADLNHFRICAFTIGKRMKFVDAGTRLWALVSFPLTFKQLFLFLLLPLLFHPNIIPGILWMGKKSKDQEKTRVGSVGTWDRRAVTASVFWLKVIWDVIEMEREVKNVRREEENRSIVSASTLQELISYLKRLCLVLISFEIQKYSRDY